MNEGKELRNVGKKKTLPEKIFDTLTKSFMAFLNPGSFLHSLSFSINSSKLIFLDFITPIKQDSYLNLLQGMPGMDERCPLRRTILELRGFDEEEDYC